MESQFCGWTIPEALNRTGNLEAFRRSLDDARLVAALRPNMRIISSENWKDYSLDDAIASKHITVGHRKYMLEDVLIFPALHSPDARERVARQSLADVVKKYVLRDPEVCRLANYMLPSQSDETVYQLLNSSEFARDYLYPFDVGSLSFELGLSTFRVRGFFESAARPKEIRDVSAVIIERWRALRTLLVEGHVIAVGTSAATRAMAPVHRLYWQSKLLYLIVETGDVYENVERKIKVTWTGLELTLGELFHMKPTLHHHIRPRTTVHVSPDKLSASQESVRKAVSALWRNRIPSELTAKQRDQQIFEWQKNNHLTVVSAKTVQRYLKRSSQQ